MRSAGSCRNIVLSILYPERLDTREAVRWGPRADVVSSIV